MTGPALVVAFMICGCGSGYPRTTQKQPTSAPEAAGKTSEAAAPAAPASATCPMAVPGTTVRAEEIAGGAAMTFTTTSDQVAELRRRVGRMAQMHNHHHREAQAHGGQIAHGSMRGLVPGESAGAQDTSRFALEAVLSEASASDVDRGARLTLVPFDSDEIEALRARVKSHAERMAATGQCPRMAEESGRAGGPPRP